MAICKFCNKETAGAATCLRSTIRIKGINYRPVPYCPMQPDQRCPECNIQSGGFHHVGCNFEICPCCGERWIYCKCSGIKKRTEECPANECQVIPIKKPTGKR